MTANFDVMHTFFVDDDWPFTQVEDQAILRMEFEGDNGRWACYAQTREEPNQVVFYSVCPFNAAEDRLMSMAELLTRLNYGTVVGNWEMDFSDGEIRFKTSIFLQAQPLTHQLMKPLVYTNIAMMDQFLPMLTAVDEGLVTPAEAVMAR